jgi:hypothetical protein
VNPNVAKFFAQIADGRWRLFDDEYSDLQRALSTRITVAANVRRINVDFDKEIDGNGVSSILLAIDLDYRGQCAPSGLAPCESEANDVARIVIDQYRRLDQIDRVRVSMIRHLRADVVDSAVAPYSRTMTVEEWIAEHRRLRTSAQVQCKPDGHHASILAPVRRSTRPPILSSGTRRIGGRCANSLGRAA